MNISTLLAAAGFLLTITGLTAEESHHHGHAAHDLHFTHPLLTESPNPEREINIRYLFNNGEEEDEHEIEVHAEYAFRPELSVEIALPVSNHDEGTDIGNLHAGVKLANFAFADKGILVTTLLTVEAPSGDGDGHHAADHWTVSTSIGGGWRNQIWEMVIFTGVTTAISPDHDDPGNIWSVDTSVIRHINITWALIAELQYERHLNGDHENDDEGLVTVGGFVFPPALPETQFGAGLSIPVTDSETEFQVVLSVILHY